MVTAAIILNYNDQERVIDLAKKLHDYAIFDYLVIVDNGSTNHDLLDNFKLDNLKIIYCKNNRGYGAGNNVGFRYLGQFNVDYVLTINSDMAIVKEGITCCFDFLNTHKEVAAAEVKMIERYKEWVSYYDISSYNWPIKCMFLKIVKKEQHDGYFYAGYVRESCAVYDFHKIKEVGYYDEDLFLYFEGPSLGAKLKEKGYKEAIIENGLFCYHNHKNTKGTRMRKVFKLQKKTFLIYLKKYCKYSAFKTFLVKYFWINPYIR